MLRVTESLEEVFKELPEDFPMKVFIFSETKPFEFSSDKFVWFQIDNIEEAHLEKSILKLREGIKNYLQGKKVDWIIADFMTLEIFREVKASICYDVHFLGRPFFASLSRYTNMHVVDEITGKNFILSLHMQHLSFVKFEARLMKRATRFIVNSQTTLASLENSYQDVCGGKKINYVPVSSELELSEDIPVVAGSGLYFHGRFHPQKGLHFLINEKWHDLPLTIRGLEDGYLTQNTLDLFKKQGITPLPWTSNSKIIRQELLAHEVILFPSIYEPWGLSLQEALSLGKICIAHFSQSGHEEQIVDGENGFLIDFSSSDFKQKILEIYSLPASVKVTISANAKKRSHLGHGARNKVLKDLLLELNAE
jgi:glycosyltransferase involved in cell wall biosynthesis